MSTKQTNVFFSKHKIQIQSGSGYRKENLTPDLVGSSRSPDPKNPKSSPCAPLLSIWKREFPTQSAHKQCCRFGFFEAKFAIFRFFKLLCFLFFFKKGQKKFYFFWRFLAK